MVYSEISLRPQYNRVEYHVMLDTLDGSYVSGYFADWFGTDELDGFTYYSFYHEASTPISNGRLVYS